MVTKESVQKQSSVSTKKTSPANSVLDDEGDDHDGDEEGGVTAKGKSLEGRRTKSVVEDEHDDTPFEDGDDDLDDDDVQPVKKTRRR